MAMFGWENADTAYLHAQGGSEKAGRERCGGVLISRNHCPPLLKSLRKNSRLAEGWWTRQGSNL
jgi:hypothetical protein